VEKNKKKIVQWTVATSDDILSTKRRYHHDIVLICLSFMNRVNGKLANVGDGVYDMVALFVLDVSTRHSFVPLISHDVM